MDRYKQYKNTTVREIFTKTEGLSEQDKNLIKLCLPKEWTNPKFKIKYFIGEQQVTPFAKLRQWLLEIKIKEGTIGQQEIELRKLALKIKKLQKEIENTADPIDKEELQIEMDEASLNHISFEDKIKDSYLERQHLLDCVHEFMETDDAKLPDGRTLMDIIDTDEEEEFEAHYWTLRLAKQAAMDISSFGRVGVGNMEAICNLTLAHQEQVLSIAHEIALNLELKQNQMRQTIAKNLGLSENVVPGLGVIQTNITNTQVNELENNSKNIENSVDKKAIGDLEDVYRI